MNKLIGLIIIAAALVGAALGWQGVSLPFFGELFGGDNPTANQIESVPDTTGNQAVTQQPGNQPTQPASQAPRTIRSVPQAQNNQGTAQTPQTTMGQADTGAGAATEDSEPVTALW